MSVRRALTLLAGVIVVYFATRALIGPEPPAPGALVAAAVFALAAVVALGVRDLAGEPLHRIPRVAAALVAVAVVLLPLIARAGADPASDPAAPQATWYTGAGGLLLTVLCVRRRPAIAWAGIAGLLATTCLVVPTVIDALAVGMAGSVVWVLSAQMLVALVERTARDTRRLADIERRSAAWQAAQLVRRRERRERVRHALEVAGPILTRVVATGGALAPDEQREAVLAEAALRDEIRGTALLDDRVRAAVARLRREGSVVSLDDEGGLDGLSPEQLVAVRDRLARVLEQAGSPQVVVRTSTLPDTAVTVAGRGAGPDALELWEEIARPDGEAPGAAGSAAPGEESG
ncbi:hypothetical protein [Microbacterium sp. gxy059]|uniref:hypothetical protein n=1 Tax=Microbacterium sp. gxy059 TaxID=2957199 RepID=UPI003D990A24